MISSDPPATRPVAELDRRFYAFALDRVVTWGLAVVAGGVGYWLLDGPNRTLRALAIAAGALVVVGAALAVLLGVRGTSPGFAATGLRVVREDGAGPIGVGRALLRQLVLGLAGLPTFGIGLAALAWTAVMDGSGRRRGWHDHLAHSVVVDARPVVVEEPEVDAAPRHVINLTAMRLVPVTASPPIAAPPRATRAAVHLPPETVPPETVPPEAVPPEAVPPETMPPETATPAPPEAPPRVMPAPPPPPAQPAPGVRPAAAVDPRPSQRQQLGYPLVPEPSATRERQATVERPVGGDGRTGALARWRVSFDSGESFVVQGLAVVGRRPEARAGEPVRHVVPLRSQDMSLSKTHAQFQVADDGALVVMDRGSTNGSILIRHGVPRELAAGRATTLVDGDLVRFGDREMTVVREA